MLAETWKKKYGRTSLDAPEVFARDFSVCVSGQTERIRLFHWSQSKSCRVLFQPFPRVLVENSFLEVGGLVLAGFSEGGGHQDGPGSEEVCGGRQF